MNLASTLLLLVLTIVETTGGVVHAAEAPPRLWEITGKNEQGVSGKFYILAVTHNGLEVEYDNYFQKFVLPIALKADTFLHESAPLVEREVPACAVPLTDTKENREILRQAYLDVERAAYDARTPIPKYEWMSEKDWAEVQEIENIHAHKPTSKLTEYGLVVSMETILFNKQLHHPEQFPKVDYTLSPDIADYIAHERSVRGMKRSESIDKSNDLYDVYCAIGPTQRGRYLQRKIADADPALFKPMSKAMRELANADFSNSIQNGYLSGILEDSPDDEYSKHAVCDRNDKWLSRMRHGLTDGIRFYALGGAHVIQPAPNHTRCDGLLLRLHKEGLTVRLVE